MECLNLEDYTVYQDKEIVEEYRLCPKCKNKIYLEFINEEYLYNCVLS